MTQEKETKTVVNYNWLELLILLIFIGGVIYLGISNSKLKDKDEKHIAKQAVLEAQKDSLQRQNRVYMERITILTAEVSAANKNTYTSEQNALQYKRKYLDLKGSIQPNICDTFIILRECEKQLGRTENLVAIMKANVLSYAKLSDTLRLSNTYLTEALATCDLLSADQKKEVMDLRKKVRRRGLMNAVIGGILGGVVIILAVK
jgi:regulator of replication initiation timing